MKIRLMSTLFALSGFLFATPSMTMAQAGDPAVKKSDTGICHEKSSPSYGATKMTADRYPWNRECDYQVDCKSYAETTLQWVESFVSHTDYCCRH